MERARNKQEERSRHKVYYSNCRRVMLRHDGGGSSRHRLFLACSMGRRRCCIAFPIAKSEHLPCARTSSGGAKVGAAVFAVGQHERAGEVGPRSSVRAARVQRSVRRNGPRRARGARERDMAPTSEIERETDRYSGVLVLLWAFASRCRRGRKLNFQKKKKSAACFVRCKCGAAT
jgi:hypothetical protein